ncbi:MAG: DUF5663 domain-containing protein [bacterium]|nr:DUF5663 domain-containing protein [bacterium]MDO8742707.1 DUF5663 domain-containing protein [bacterium]
MENELATQIAADLGIASLPAEEQKSLIAQFGEVALKAATLAVVGKMTDAARDEFTKLAQAGDAAAVQVFLNREVPDHESLAKVAVAEEVKRFKAFQAP